MARQQRGRPPNEDAYTKLIETLKGSGATVRKMSEDLSIPLRTVYHYLDRAESEGYRVVKNGHKFTSPYIIEA